MHFVGRIGPGGVMAGEAINLLFRCEVEVFTLPFVTDVAEGAIGFVRRDRDQCAVQDVPFAKQLSRFTVRKLPVPVSGRMHLLGGQVMATQASLCQFLTRLKFLLQDVEVGMVGGR